MSIDQSAKRKAEPVWSGVLRYFPDAIRAVARLSKAGNDKHNPGEPLHWSRHKSTDQGDCLVRHQLTPEQVDPETGELHAAAVAWRALAQLQLLEEARTQQATVVQRDTKSPGKGLCHSQARYGLKCFDLPEHQCDDCPQRIAKVGMPGRAEDRAYNQARTCAGQPLIECLTRRGGTCTGCPMRPENAPA